MNRLREIWQRIASIWQRFDEDTQNEGTITGAELKVRLGALLNLPQQEKLQLKPKVDPHLIAGAVGSTRTEGEDTVSLDGDRSVLNRRPIRIVIADDHPIFRDALHRLLESESDLKVIGEARDGAEAVKVSRQLKPDILLLDLAMPRHPGLEALREMDSGTGSNGVRVILLTAAIEQNQIVEALQLGARGVVLKASATQLLFEGIHTVMSGKYWVGRESVSNLVHDEGDAAREDNLTDEDKTFLSGMRIKWD